MRIAFRIRRTPARKQGMMKFASGPCNICMVQSSPLHLHNPSTQKRSQHAVCESVSLFCVHNLQSAKMTSQRHPTWRPQSINIKNKCNADGIQKIRPATVSKNNERAQVHNLKTKIAREGLHFQAWQHLQNSPQSDPKIAPKLITKPIEIIAGAYKKQCPK